MSVEFALTQVANGVSLAGLLFLLASGLTVIFGLMRIVNLAHGAFYLVGGYVGLTTILTTHNFWLGLLAAGLLVAALGLVTERVLLRRLRGQELPEVLLSVGLATLLGDLALAIWGGDPRTVPLPSYLTGSVQFGSFVYPRFRVVVTLCAIVVGALLYYLQNHTRIGAIIRAGVDDREVIAALGINVNRVFTGVFAFGALLAGFAGVIGGAFLSLVPGADTDILLLGLVVVIIGGLGSLQGSALGSVIVGLIDAFGRSLAPQVASFLIFGAMAVVLILRPSGLLGRRS